MSGGPLVQALRWLLDLRRLLSCSQTCKAPDCVTSPSRDKLEDTP